MALEDERVKEIKRALASSDPRDIAHVKQALNDAEACRESRRVSVSANACDCFCCSLERWKRIGVLVKVASAKGFVTAHGIAGFIHHNYNLRVDLTEIEQHIRPDASPSEESAS